MKPHREGEHPSEGEGHIEKVKDEVTVTKTTVIIVAVKLLVIIIILVVRYSLLYMD